MRPSTKSRKAAAGLPIVVVGGGPAGMTAALAAVEKYRNVILYDKNPLPGMKLGSVTSEGFFVAEKLPFEKLARAFGDKEKFIKPAFRAYGWKEISEQLKNSRITLSKDGGGRLMIPPEQAAHFSLRLKEGVESSGVVIKKSCRVTGMDIKDGVISGVFVNGLLRPAASVIIASGSCAAPKRGSTSDGYELARKANHTIVPIKPAMVGLETVERYGRLLADVRVRDCQIDVFLNNRNQLFDRGSLIFTRYGLEGDLILNHSAHVIDLLQKGTVKIYIDLIPDFTKAEIERKLGQDFGGADRTTVWEILTRYIPDGMLDVMHKMVRIHSRRPAVHLSTLERKLLAIWLKDLVLTIKRPRPFNETKGVLGGVSTEEIDPETMRSLKVPNLYFAGEVMDLLGPWGGYNIEMAFATGHLAGTHAATSVGGSKGKKLAS